MLKQYRLNSLEGIRGFASMMVILSHLAVMFYPAYYWDAAVTGGDLSHCNGIDVFIGSTPLNIVNGHTWLMMFFILTGFGTFMVFQRGKESVHKYMILRYFKLLAICVLGTVGIVVLANIGLLYFNEVVEVSKTPWFTGFSIEGGVHKINIY